MIKPTTIQLSSLVMAWGQDNFNDLFKETVSNISSDQLPLQQALSQSSYVSNSPLNVLVLETKANEQSIYVKAGIFFQGLIPGCNCADDPTPEETYNEYCECHFVICKLSGETSVTPL